MKEDKRLDQELEKHIGATVADHQPEEWCGLREHARLQALYPGKFVAYLDHFEGEGHTLRLRHREVLCVSRTLPGLHKRLEALPEEKRKTAQVSYVEPAESQGRWP